MKKTILISALLILCIYNVNTQFQHPQLMTTLLLPYASDFLINPSGTSVISFDSVTQALFENPCVSPRGKAVNSKGKKTSGNGIIIIEAESTRSDMGEWILVIKGDKNYVDNASGGAYIEFTGNSPGKGDPSSPIEYTFKVPVNGNYRLLMMTSKRLEGARGDMCNDAWVKMSGNFKSATNLSREQLTNYLKFFQGGASNTPENAWHWAIRSGKDHVFYVMSYKFKKGKEYTLTIAGRSQRFSIDYIVLFDESKFTLAEAQEKARSQTRNTDSATIKDADGNIYHTVIIGQQQWMTENLKTTRYNDGTPITCPGTENTAWSKNITGAYAWYNNDETTYRDMYGALYNWYAINTGKLCPAGWHVPSDAEWTIMLNHLGGGYTAGGKFKEAGTEHWKTPNIEATNESGFSALPGGGRDYNGRFFEISTLGRWGSSSEYDDRYVWGIGTFNVNSSVHRGVHFKGGGVSIRCVRDL